MALSEQQVANLLVMVTNVESDELDCEGCFSQVAEFADQHLSSSGVSEAMRAVQVHMEQCACCKDEFNALLKGLAAIEE